MSEYGLTKENFLAALPMALREDASVAALAEAAAEFLARPVEEIRRLKLYPEIDQMDERLLDILAYDFKVDWWDPEYTLEEKRRTLKDSWRVHKLLGTKAAVERAISAIYPDARVREWFEYGGRPYYFRLHLDLTGTKWTEERPRRILERVEYYKSLRSHLEEMEYVRSAPPVNLRVGGVFGTMQTLPVPEAPDGMKWKGEARFGGAAAVLSVLPVPEWNQEGGI